MCISGVGRDVIRRWEHLSDLLPLAVSGLPGGRWMGVGGEMGRGRGRGGRWLEEGVVVGDCLLDGEPLPHLPSQIAVQRGVDQFCT